MEALRDARPEPGPGPVERRHRRRRAGVQGGRAGVVLALRPQARRRRDDRPRGRRTGEARRTEGAARREVPRGAGRVADLAGLDVHRGRGPEDRTARLRPAEWPVAAPAREAVTAEAGCGFGGLVASPRPRAA